MTIQQRDPAHHGSPRRGRRILYAAAITAGGSLLAGASTELGAALVQFLLRILGVELE